MPPLEVKGHTGQIQFDGTYITITRKGFLARAGVGKGEKRLHIAQISGVQWKPAGGLVNGFIQFTVPGGVERRSAFGKQTTDAARDENSVVFTKAQMPAFEHLRQEIDNAIARQHQPQQPMYAPPVQANPADQIGQLWALHQQGAMTLEEFQAQKARILGQ